MYVLGNSVKIQTSARLLLAKIWKALLSINFLIRSNTKTISIINLQAKFFKGCNLGYLIKIYNIRYFQYLN